MRRLGAVLIFVLTSLTAYANPTVYYLDGIAGNDSYSGLSPTQAWKTSAPVTAWIAAHPGPQCVTWAFKAGQRWNDTLAIRTIVAVDASTTLASNPPNGGSAACAMTIDSYGDGTAYITGSDDLPSTVWTQTPGYTGVWQTSYTGAKPGKLYMDSPMAESVALLPAPNYAGVYSNSIAYNFLDQVDYTGVGGNGQSGYVHNDVKNYGAGNAYPTLQFVWYQTSFPAMGRTGIQNVAQGVPPYDGDEQVPVYKGVWYVDASNIYVRLADGSNPSAHTFHAAHRNNGIVLESANYVTITANIVVEQTIDEAILAYQSADSTQAGQYFTNEYITILSSVYNCGRQGGNLNNTQTSAQFPTHGCIDVVSGGGVFDTEDSSVGLPSQHMIRGIYIAPQHVGMVDDYWDGGVQQGAIELSGIDGGGTANNIVVSGVDCSAVTSACLVYSNKANTSLLNNGGRITGVNFHGNDTNLYFTGTRGGMIDSGWIHQSLGQGIQIGGGDNPNPSDPPLTITHMVIQDLGASTNNKELYNGIDCNSATNTYNVVETYNTIVNTYSNAFTLESKYGEAGCRQATVYGNIFDQNHYRYLQDKVPNTSNIFYYTQMVGDQGDTFHNNLYSLSQHNSIPISTSSDGGPVLTCSDPNNFFTQFPDTQSSCTDTVQYANYPANDLRLAFGSPGFNAGPGGTSLGALGTVPVSIQASGTFAMGVRP